MDFYLDEKQRKKHRKRLKIKIYLAAFCFLLLLAAATYAVVWSPLFQIKNFVGSETIISQLKNFFANQSKIAEFLGADNILVWSNSKLAQFKKNSEINEITIEKDYFRREIKISVKQREKFGVWCSQAQNHAELTQNNAEPIQQTNAEILQDSASSQRGSAAQCAWFDKNGVLFSEALASEGNLINKINDFSGQPLNIGDSVLNEKLFSNLIKIFDVLEKSGLGIKTLKLERPELQEISTPSTNSGPKIYFSLRNDPNFALSAIEYLKSVGLNKLEYIDFRVENRVYYK